MKGRPGTPYYGDREVCPCKACCQAVPGRAAAAQRQRAAMKRRFARVVLDEQEGGVR